MYKDACMEVNAGTISTGAPTTEPESITNTELKTVLKQTEDNFWLLSQTEVQTIFGAGQYSDAASLPATVQGEPTSGPRSWSLRSPYAGAGSGDNAWFVEYGGYVYHSSVYITLGVRPAFKI